MQIIIAMETLPVRVGEDTIKDSHRVCTGIGIQKITDFQISSPQRWGFHYLS